MRRAASSVLLALGLLSASVAWWAFAASATVLDPERSERIADTLIGQPVIQDAVAEGLGTALQQALPPGTPISSEEIGAAAHRALADPRAMAAVRTAVLSSHRRLVGNYDGPVTLDVSPVAVAGRDALLTVRPDLADAIPAAPPLSIDLPTRHLPKLGWLPERTRELAGLAGLAAVTWLALGMVAASDRPGVLARAGKWSVRAGVLWAMFGWGLPYAMTKVGEPRLAALGALGVSAVGPMIAPAVLMVCTGIGALLGARAWRLVLATLPPAPLAAGPGASPGVPSGSSRPVPGTVWPGTSGTASWDPVPLPSRMSRRSRSKPDDETVSTRDWRV